MKTVATLAVCAAMMTTAACDRIEFARLEMSRRWWDWRERAFQNDMGRIAKDRHAVYQLDYALTDYWLAYYRDDAASPRVGRGGRFDIQSKLKSWGVEPTAVSSAVLDTSKRTITIIDTGPNIALIEVCFEPMRPQRYRVIKTRSSPPP